MKRSLALALLWSTALAPLAAPPARSQDDVSNRALVEEMMAAAMAALEGGDLDGGIAVLEGWQGSEMPPPVVSLLGALYLEDGRPAEALEVLAPLSERFSDPAVLYNAGRAALATGQAERGIGYLERSVLLEPATPAARQLGMIRGSQGEYADAFSLLRGWFEANPDDHEAGIAAANAAIEFGLTNEADELIAALPEEDPRVRLLRGRLLLLEMDPHGAAETLAPLLESPDERLRRDVTGLVGEALLSAGDAGRAVEVLSGIDDPSPRLALLLARANSQSGDAAGAVEALAPFADRALGSESAPDPPLDQLLLTHGQTLVQLGEHGRAVPYLRRATELLPETREAWYALAQALAGAGEPEEAKAAVTRADTIEPEEPEATRPLPPGLPRARAFMADGRLDDALDVVRREISLRPDDPMPRLVASRILLLQGRLDEAMALAETTLELDATSPEAWYQRGAVNMAAQRRDVAEADFRRALELAPTHTGVMNDLAVLLAAEGRRDEARALLERVLSLSPDDPQASENLRRLEGAS